MPLSTAQPDAVAQMYAKSLFELAEAKGGAALVESVLGELDEILELTRGNPKFAELLSSPAIAADARAASLDRIFKGRIGDLTHRFLQVLNEKGRLASLPQIASAYDSVVQAKFGRVEVDVFTAEPLTGHDIASIRDRLARSMGKEIIVHPYVEGAMIGGVKLRIGDQLIDGSIATRLRALRDTLGTNGLTALRSRLGRVLGS